MARMARWVGGRWLLALTGRFLQAGVMVGNVIQSTHIGTPQSGALSPLVANTLLDDLNHELEPRATASSVMRAIA